MNRKIFFAELHDEYQSLLRTDETALVRRASCYILLADGIILHPAYLWLSQETHRLVFEKLADIFRPPYCEVVLGDAQSIPDYMQERMEKLRRGVPQGSTQEARKYAYWESRLLVEAKRLDTRFPADARTIMRKSRDTKFRDLLAADLDVAADPASLINQIAAHSAQENLAVDQQEICERLKGFVKSAELVSLETFGSEVRRIGLPGLTESGTFKARMLTLYYYANVEGGIQVPGLANLMSEAIVNPFDADVFWNVFAKLFGKKPAQYLSASADPTVVKTLQELRDTPVWQEYRRAYFEVLEAVDDNLLTNATDLAKKIRTATGQDELTVVARLWRERKLEIASTVFGALGVCTISGPGVVLGALSMTFSAWRLPGAIRRFNDQYRQHDLTQLQSLIRNAVTSIVENKPPLLQ